MSDLNNGISRRSVLKGAAVGGLGLAAGGSLLAGCGDKATGPLAYGARSVDAGPTAQNEALIAAYTQQRQRTKLSTTQLNQMHSRTTFHSIYREHLTILLSGWLDTVCSSSQSRVCSQI